jgi:peptidoglycan/LPS O-acetylase OafA/YrhL
MAAIGNRWNRDEPGTENGRDRFVVLDSWRGLAAIFIILFHAQVASHVHDAGLVRAGEMFVDFFFVLSGFVISHAYAGRLSTPAQFGRFMYLRIGRVMPLHLVMLFLFVLMEAGKAFVPGLGAAGDAAFTGTNSIGAIFTNMALVQVGTHDQLTWNTPAWSIAAELAAYVAFGVAALAVGRFLGLAAAAGAILAAGILWSLAPRGMESTYDFGDFRAIYGLCVGVLAYRFMLGRGPRPSAVIDRLPAMSSLAWTLVEIATVAAMLAYVAYAYGTVAAFAAPVVFAVVVVVFATERGLVSSVLRMRPAVALGTISFSIYMVHMFVIMRVVNVARLSDKVIGSHTVMPMGHGGEGIDLGSRYAGDLVMLGLVAITIAVSLVSYRLVERPGRAWFRRTSDRLFAAPRPSRFRRLAAASAV